MKVTIATLRTPPEGWSLELEVDKDTTVAKFKELLAGLSGGPQINRTTKILNKVATGQIYTLLDTEKIRKNMLLTDPSQPLLGASTSKQDTPGIAADVDPHSQYLQQMQQLQLQVLLQQHQHKPQQFHAAGPAPGLPTSAGGLRLSAAPDARVGSRPVDLDKSMRARLLSMLSSRWAAAAPVSDGGVAHVRGAMALLREQQAQLKRVADGETPHLTRLCVEVFAGSSDVWHRHPHGVPMLNEVILRMANTVLCLYKPILAKNGMQEGVVGLVHLDQTILAQLGANEVAELAAANLAMLCFGDDACDAADQLMFHVMWKDISAGVVPQVGIFMSYLHHLALPPLERRMRSQPRTMSFLSSVFETVLRTVNKAAKLPMKQAKKVLWVVGASDAVEGELARRHYFEDAACFLEADVTVYLIGDDFTGMWPRGRLVQVQTGSWQDAVDGLLPPPSLMFYFNTGIGTLEPSLVEQWLPRIIGGLVMPLERRPALVLTCRCEAEARGERRILQHLGVSPVVPTEQPQPVRNLFSAMAGSPDIDFDDSGWFTMVYGSNLAADVLTKWMVEPLCFLQEVNQVDTVVEGPLQELAPAAAPEPAGTETEAEAKPKSPAVFWGILDLKYDPGAGPPEARVKVLETGDGRASRFSGYGAAIKEAFQQENRLEETIRRAVLTENKKLTHDTVVECGYAHLRPQQAAFRKAYTPDLADKVRAALGLRAGDICVLKLCNRARGAGVVPVPAADLDQVLSEMLQPPSNLQEWARAQPKDWAREVQWGCFQEQVRHWWSNECPVFLVEAFCQSLPTEKNGQPFDGTMRVGFSLHREDKDRLPPGWVYSPEGPIYVASGGRGPGPYDPGRLDDLPVEPKEKPRPWDDDRPYLDLFRPGTMILRQQWLGGYWKLPIEDMSSSDLRGKIVSVAKQGTAPVAAHHLHEVYSALGDMVQKLFGFHDMSHNNLMKKYSDIPELGAFVCSRLACSMRIRDRQKSLMVLRLAQSHVEKFHGQPRDVVCSYIFRNFGVYEALQGNWKSAAAEFRKSLEAMPTNATSLYLLGMAHLELGDLPATVTAMEEALLLDPDFKAPYVNLGVARLRLGQPEPAAEVSQAGLVRHPGTPHLLYNLAMAKLASAHMEANVTVRRKVAADSVPLQIVATEVAGATSLRSDEEQRFETVHVRVIVRSSPSTGAAPLGVIQRGQMLGGTPCTVNGDPWLHLSEEGCRELGINAKEAWVLIDGRSVGLGDLLLPSQRQEVEVVIRHGQREGEVTVRVPASATIRQVRAALLRLLGRSTASPAAQLVTKVAGVFKRLEDAEPLGMRRELTVLGVSLPVAGTSLPGLPQAPSLGGSPPGALRVPSNAAPVNMTEQVRRLLAQAREALEGARDSRGKEQPWTERDDELVAMLQGEHLTLPLPGEPPRDGWRFFGWRP